MCSLPLGLNRPERLPTLQTNSPVSRRNQSAKRTHPLSSDFLGMRLEHGEQLAKGTDDRGQPAAERRTKRFHRFHLFDLLPPIKPVLLCLTLVNNDRMRPPILCRIAHIA